MNNNTIPKTDSIQELAEFWDTHDLTQFDDELEEVADPIFDRRAVLSLHLPEKEAAEIKRIAASRGVADEDLVREWILEKVHAS